MICVFVRCMVVAVFWVAAIAVKTWRLFFELRLHQDSMKSKARFMTECWNMVRCFGMAWPMDLAKRSVTNLCFEAGSPVLELENIASFGLPFTTGLAAITDEAACEDGHEDVD